MWQPFLFRLDSVGSQEVEAPTRFAPPPLRIHLLVEYLGRCCRVSHLGEDGSLVSRRDEWDQSLPWHLSQPAAKSILVAGSVSEVYNSQALNLQAHSLTPSWMTWKEVGHLLHF